MPFEQVIKSTYIGEEIYKKTLSSGLQVYILPKKHFAKKYVFFATQYGGINNVFDVEGKGRIEMPQGIAHFLEHQIFEDKDKSTFEKFEKIGANINAYTSYTSTVYYFDIVDDFEEGLKLLMDLVQTTSISDKSVIKEKDVIEQEIRMYQDEPDWLLSTNLFKGMYQNHPIKDDIAGTPESIRKISKEQILSCYDYFYNPQNMIMFLFGDLDAEKTIELIDNNQSDSFIKKQFTPKLIIPKEPFSVYKQKMTEYKSIGKGKLLIGFKAKPFDANEQKEKSIAALKIANDLMFGRSGQFYMDAYEKGWVTDGFDFDVQTGEGYAHSIIGNETDHIDSIYEGIINEINRAKQYGFNPEDFLRMKKKILGRMVASFNSLQSIASNYTYNKMRGGDLFKQIEAYNTLTFEDVQLAIQSFYDVSNHSISTIYRNNTK